MLLSAIFVNKTTFLFFLFPQCFQYFFKKIHVLKRNTKLTNTELAIPSDAITLTKVVIEIPLLTLNNINIKHSLVCIIIY